MPKRLLSIPILVWLLMFPVLGWADFQAGKNAYEHGDYVTVLKEWRPLAEQGNAVGQVILGTMYAIGRGVPQDLVLAHMWTNLAAAQGFTLGMDARKELEKIMKKKQLVQAQALASEWKPTLSGPSNERQLATK